MTYQVCLKYFLFAHSTLEKVYVEKYYQEEAKLNYTKQSTVIHQL